MHLWHLLLGVFAFVQGQPQAVPRGSAPTLDGTIGPAEWTDAADLPLGTGGHLYLKHDGRDLHVAIRGSGLILADLCVERGDTVRVLHSSASLGTATYAPGGTDSRTRLGVFAWALRDGTAESRGPAGRQEHYDRFGWAATTVGMAG
ncbi:MAG: hypothetical protein HOP28_01345, partial [Gemmatimonadales bacterium]|nr:hypothetical protein [Gemmatimonadales bacterium]